MLHIITTAPEGPSTRGQHWENVYWKRRRFRW